MQNWASPPTCYHWEIHSFEKSGRGNGFFFSLGKRKLAEREECEREGRQRGLLHNCVELEVIVITAEL